MEDSADGKEESIVWDEWDESIQRMPPEEEDEDDEEEEDSGDSEDNEEEAEEAEEEEEPISKGKKKATANKSDDEDSLEDDENGGIHELRRFADDGCLACHRLLPGGESSIITRSFQAGHLLMASLLLLEYTFAADLMCGATF